MRVYESALAPRLKATAGVIALAFADDAGANIYPSVARVGWLTGKSDRQIRADLAALCAQGVLTAVTARTGGKGLTTRYRMNEAALPTRPPFPSKRGNSLPGIHQTNSEVDSRVSESNPEADYRVSITKAEVCDTKPGSLEHVTRKFGTPNPEVGFRRSVRDPVDPSLIRTVPRSTVKAELAAEPNSTNYKPIAALVRDLLSQQQFNNQADVVEAAKDRCASCGIDYGRHEAVPFTTIHRAVASEWFKHRNPDIVRTA